MPNPAIAASVMLPTVPNLIRVGEVRGRAPPRPPALARPGRAPGRRPRPSREPQPSLDRAVRGLIRRVPYSVLSHLECPACGDVFDASAWQWLGARAAGP